MNEDYSHLYDIPIETLELSTEAWRALKRAGMWQVGDCIDFYRRGAMTGICIIARPPFFSVLAGEVKEKIKAHGYWHYVEDNFYPNDKDIED